MANMLFANNANTTLASSLTNVATTMSVTSASAFPSPTGSQYFYCTLADAATQTTIEIVKVTAVSGTTFTIVRGQDGTSGTAFASGAVVSLRLVRASLNDFPKLDETNTFTQLQTLNTLAVSGFTSTTPILSFNASNCPIASGSAISGSYLQFVLQNTSGTAGASTNYVLSNDLGTDSSYYGEFGINSSVYSSGTPADFFSINNGVYFSGHDGDITIGSGNGKKLYLAWGTSGGSAHVINASGAIGLNTNLASGTGSGTTNFGTVGQVLTSQGSSATPTWTSVGTGTVTSVAASVPSFLSISGSPITTSGTLAISYSGTALPVANGGTGQTSFTANYIHYGSFSTSSTFTFNGTTLSTPSITTTSDAVIHGVNVGIGAGSGSNNVVLGNSAGSALTSGATNTLIGASAGSNITTGTANIIIGGLTNAGSATDTNSIAIGVGTAGQGSNTTRIATYQGGYGSVYQGNNSTVWAITSDQRLKKNIVDNTIGLDAITKIKVRNFEYRLPEEITDLPQNSAINIQGVQIGAIAQELEAVIPECVKQELNGIYRVDATNLTWYMVNSIQQLNTIIQTQAAQIAALQAKVGA
jgi:rRNA-processing protein FCF1